MKYLVVGSGRMSRGIIHDLLNLNSTEQVIVTDISDKALLSIQTHFRDNRLETHQVNANDKDRLMQLMDQVAGVISAVPYDYNFNLTRWAIATGCHFVDLGGNNSIVQKQFTLDADAKKAGVGVIPDCGLAPGMASVLSRYIVDQLEQVDNLNIRVGGLPLNPQTPLNYMLVFSVRGLINEYLEPAIILDDGEIKTVPSLTAIEELAFPHPFDRLEAFYTSGGTSTLPQTYAGKIRHLDYKTIRYPGHCRLFKSMLDLEFSSNTAVRVKDKQYSRRELFEALLVDPLSYEAEDAVLMRITAEGNINGTKLTKSYQTIQYGNKEMALTAMMRATAFPAAIALEMLVEGTIKETGVLKQELAIPPQRFITALSARGIAFESV